MTLHELLDRLEAAAHKSQDPQASKTLNQIISDLIAEGVEIDGPA